MPKGKDVAVEVIDLVLRKFHRLGQPEGEPPLRAKRYFFFAGRIGRSAASGSAHERADQRALAASRQATD